MPVLFPIPQAAISSKSKGVINQNFGYDGYLYIWKAIKKMTLKKLN